MSPWRTQVIEMLGFFISNTNSGANFAAEKSKIKVSGVSYFLVNATKLEVNSRPRI